MNLDFNRRLSIAPMLDCTDRHERYFLRLISKNILLYSEMVVATGLIPSPNRRIAETPAPLPDIMEDPTTTPCP